MFTVKGSVWGGGGADKAGHTRRLKAPVQTVTVCYSYKQRHLLRRAVRNGELGASHFLTYLLTISFQQGALR